MKQSAGLSIVVAIALNLPNIANASGDTSQKVDLGEVSVKTHRISAKKAEISSNKITSDLIMDEKDLIKNQTGITANEGGRSGNNGYAMRGVDRDRVSIKVDSMEAAESFSPTFHQKQGFISGVRNSTEIENLSTISVTKGADSITNGSGAIGGSVNMRTKIAQDFVEDGNIAGFYSKTAYASKNSEIKQVTGAGVIYEGFEGLFQYTRRLGKQTKNYNSKYYEDHDICGTLRASSEVTRALDSGVQNDTSILCGYSRILPDPLKYQSKSYLAKFGYRFFDDHFLNFFYDKKSIKNHINEKSFQTTGSAAKTFSTDKTPYKRYGIYYEYMPSDGILEEVRLQIARQRVDQIYSSSTYILPDLFPDVPPIIRKTNNIQTKTQIDLSSNTSDLEFANTYHSFYTGIGGFKSRFENKSFFSSLVRIRGGRVVHDGFFTYTKPVEIKNYHIYLKDKIQLTDNLSTTLGVRYDKYRYKMKDSNLPGFNIDTTQKFKTQKPNKNLHSLTYQAELKYDITPNLNINYRFNTAFRAPKVEEMYIEYESSDIHRSNLNLKPEEAKNHEIGINFENKFFEIDATAFYTRYKNFIDHTLSNERVCTTTFWGTTRCRNYKIFQYQNINKAFIKGVEISSKINAGVFGFDEGIFATFKAVYQKGKKSDRTSLMAAQPLTLAVGLGYSMPNDKFDIVLSTRYERAKNPKDAKYKLNDNSAISNANNTKVEEYPYLSKSYFVADLTAQAKISKNFKLNFGVFNVFNRKYITWDTIRASKENGTMTAVKKNGNILGLDRYTSPGRNFGVSFEIKY